MTVEGLWASLLTGYFILAFFVAFHTIYTIKELKEIKRMSKQQIDDCVKCPHCKCLDENEHPDCEIFNGDFAEFMEKCPQMNGAGASEKRDSRSKK